MSGGSSIPYKLRPNKSVDRELFLSLLVRLSTVLKFNEYKYVGLGGPFMEDFRLVHARIGIETMDCIEAQENVHKRQSFNRPMESINCIHSSLEDYLEQSEFDRPVILWLDFNDPKSIQSQIETFSEQVLGLPLGSIVRVTLNANPSSLGKPDASQLAVNLPGEAAAIGGLQTELDWRLERFKERLADFFPANLMSGDMTHKNFGRSVLKAVWLAVEKKMMDSRDRRAIWALATNYSDGQPMITATLLVNGPQDAKAAELVRNWEYFSRPQDPLILDMPGLSTLERLTMESCEDPRGRMGFELPRSDMGEDPFVSFKRFYRVFPHFSRVEL